MMTKSAAYTHVRCISILLVLLLLLSVVPFTASASGTSVTPVTKYILTGSFQGGKFDLSSSSSRLFHIEDMLPGESWSGQIQIQNGGKDQMSVRLLSITSDLRDQTLFNALDLVISCKGKILYSGSYSTGLKEITDLYVLDSKESLILDVVVTLPVSAGNEVQNKEMDSTWTFEAFYQDAPKTGENLATQNTTNLYALWILILALMAAAIVALRIKHTMHVQKKQTEEVNRK